MIKSIRGTDIPLDRFTVNGKFTITNDKGEHRTFSIKTQSKDAKFAPGQRVLALLSGADNDADYRGFAFVDDTHGVSVWRSKCGAPGNPSIYEWYAELFGQVFKAAAVEGRDLTDPELSFAYKGHGYRVLVSKRCCVCNRTLTTPESIRSGIGPVCANGGGL